MKRDADEFIAHHRYRRVIPAQAGIQCRGLRPCDWIAAIP